MSTELQDMWWSVSNWPSVICMPVVHHHRRSHEALQSQACLLVLGKDALIVVSYLYFLHRRGQLMFNTAFAMQDR